MIEKVFGLIVINLYICNMAEENKGGGLKSALKRPGGGEPKMKKTVSLQEDDSNL